MRRALGLDFGSEQIKIVELHQKRGFDLVTGYAKVNTSKGAIGQGKVLNQDLLLSDLKRLLAKLNPKTENVILGLSGQDVLIRQTSLPSMPDRDIAQSLEFELENIFKLTPSKVNQFVYSYSILSKTENEIKLLVVGCQRNLIQPYIDVVKEVGLEPHVIDIAAFNLSRILGEDKNVCFVDLGAQQTIVYVQLNGVYSVYRILPIGGQLIDDGISECFAVDLEGARELKLKHDIDYLLVEGTGSKSLLRSIVQQYVGGILQTLDYLRAQSRSSSITEVLDQVLLCGGNANLQGLDSLLTEELGLAVKVLNPFALLDKQAELIIPEEGAIYANAVGLALRGLDEK